MYVQKKRASVVCPLIQTEAPDSSERPFIQIPPGTSIMRPTRRFFLGTSICVGISAGAARWTAAEDEPRDMLEAIR